MNAPTAAPSYEVWHHDGARPELLGQVADKGEGRRLWRNSRHVVIAKDGLLLEPRSGTGDKQLRAMKLAIADAHQRATGAAPEPVKVGPVAGNGLRRVETKGLRALAETPVEPMPPKPARPAALDEPEARPAYSPAPAEVIPEVEAHALPEAIVIGPPTVRRRTAPATPAPEETPMPATRCPCGEPSAPVKGAGKPGRPGTPEFADLCQTHRTSAMGYRVRRGITSAEARAEVLAAIAGEPISRVASKPASKPVKKTTPAKPSRRPLAAPKPPPVAVAEAPVSDLLAMVRRQRAAIDALGGIDQAERLAAVVSRVGGVSALEALVDELVGGAR